ncbi:MAG: hypothetical protein IMY67_02580, partial [Bacteroidetes bacterium]|nr:hypothetical protein [Bacteroidota bacterium]
MISKKLISKTLIYLLTLIIFASCKTDKKEQVDYSNKVESKDNVIEVVTNVMDFVTVDTIKSGWNTFKYINKSNEPHFLLFDDYPDGKTLDTVKAVIMPPFDKGMALIMEGNMDAALVEFGKLPDWFPQVQFVGGTGLISPGHEANVTVKLEPGLHIMECYVKMADGMFHASMGMAKEFWVLDEDTGNHPPKASINISISSTEGINYDKPISKGKHIFSVYYGDQTVHEHFLGHDVNLMKLDENTNIDELEAWMNWATPTGLMTPSPEGVTFLGGTNDIPAGSTQYFKVNLEPGNYAFISEVPNA